VPPSSANGSIDPNAGWPLLTPGFNLTTGWQTVPLLMAELGGALQAISASSDDMLWFGTESGGLWTYASNEGLLGWNTLSDGVVNALATPAPGVAYAATSPQWTGSGGPFTITAFQNGQITSLGALPNGDQPEQLAAGPDGTFWVLSQSGTVYSWTGSAWTTIDSAGFGIQQIAISSAQAISAIGTNAAGAADILQYDANTGWQVDTTFPASGASWISACADGSVWVIAGSAFYLNTGQGWYQPPVAVPTPDMLFGFTASSASRCYLLFTDGAAADLVSVLCLSLGVVDRQPLSWPVMTTEEQDVYNAISWYLTTAPNSDIRSLYNDATGNFSDMYSKLDNATWDGFRRWYESQGGSPPLHEPAWNVMQPQIENELQYVQNVFTLNGQIKGLNNQIQIVNNDVMPGVWGMVGLTAPSGNDGPSTIDLVLSAVFQAALWGIATMFTGGAAFAASAVASLAGSVISGMQGNGNQPDTGNALTIQYSDLTTTMASLYSSTASLADTTATTTVQDWGMLRAVGSAIQTGAWRWPLTESDTLATATNTAFNLYFYKFLMPAKWQIVYTPYADYIQYPWTITPGYLTWTEPNGYELGMPVENVWFCNGLGAGVDLNGSLEPFPDQQLLTTIFAFDINPADFFTGQNGWTLQQVTATT